MGRWTGLLGAALGCMGAGMLIFKGMIEQRSAANDFFNAWLLWGIIFLVLFILAGRLALRERWRPLLEIGAACTLFAALGMWSIGVFLFPGSVLILLTGLERVLNAKA